MRDSALKRERMLVAAIFTNSRRRAHARQRFETSRSVLLLIQDSIAGRRRAHARQRFETEKR